MYLSNCRSNRLDATANHMKRLLDVVLAVGVAFVILLPLLLLAVLVKLTSRGPILYWSDRVGSKNVPFRMPKFRSIRLGSPALATHLLGNPDFYLTPVGSLLHKLSLDELPQARVFSKAI